MKIKIPEINIPQIDLPTFALPKFNYPIIDFSQYNWDHLFKGWNFNMLDDEIIEEDLDEKCVEEDTRQGEEEKNIEEN